MNFKAWLNWYRSLQISRKWFVILILLRPIIDNFYELKETSVLASPLYIVGILTPLLVLFSFTSKNFSNENKAVHDVLIKVFAFFLFGNCLYFFFTQFSISALGDVVKYTTPILLYFYARSFIRSKQDLDGILFSCLIACIFPLGMLLYESFVNPIAIEYISTGRGGGSRIRGAYADIMNYAVYIVLFFITISYWFLSNLYGKTKLKINAIHVASALVLVVYALSRIKHVSTWSVTFFVFLLLMIHNLRNVKGLIFVVVLLTIISSFFAQSIYDSQIEPLIGKELKVIEGESETNHAFNGRMNRWERYFEIWEQMPMMNHFIGITSANFPETDNMIGAGMHSDYVRLLFLTGFIGVAAYVLFILAVGSRYTQLRMPEKFLLASTVSALLLWSVSTIPTLYAPLIYFMYPIFAYALLPKKLQYS
jgi:hypothetical protein